MTFSICSMLLERVVCIQKWDKAILCLDDAV